MTEQNTAPEPAAPAAAAPQEPAAAEAPVTPAAAVAPAAPAAPAAPEAPVVAVAPAIAAVPAAPVAPAVPVAPAIAEASQEPGEPGAPEAPEASQAAALPEAPEAPTVPKDRRKLFAALRWTAAVLAFGAVGTGVAYGITQPERTDIPGLSTKDDGRWVFPATAVTKPTLAPGAAQPFAEDNKDGIHYATLGELLLPAPRGSAQDPALKLEKDQMVSQDTFLEEYAAGAREKMKQGFIDDGLRQIAARGWVMPDGTRTRIYLLRFHSSGFADAFEGCGMNMEVGGVNRMEADPVWSKAKTSQFTPDLQSLSVFSEAAPFGDDQVKVGCIQSGDLQAVVLQTRKGEVAAVPFHQTVILQDQLLS